MSTHAGKRYLTSKDFPPRRDGQGRPLCRWCGMLVQPPRRAWCGDVCIEAYLGATDASRINRRILARDEGRCQLCGLAVGLLQEVDDHAADHHRALRWGWEHAGTTHEGIDWLGYLEPSDIFSSEMLARMGVDRNVHGYFYEIDHIRPVSEGGGPEDTNLRTLCIFCHRGETAALVQRLAKARRLAAGHPDFAAKHPQLELEP